MGIQPPERPPGQGEPVWVDAQSWREAVRRDGDPAPADPLPLDEPAADRPAQRLRPGRERRSMREAVGPLLGDAALVLLALAVAALVYLALTRS